MTRLAEGGRAKQPTLPWEDPHERGPGHPNWSATCDWGDCDDLSVTMRWDDKLKQWLSVCAGHAPVRISRCAALPPQHEPWECHDPAR